MCVLLVPLTSRTLSAQTTLSVLYNFNGLQGSSDGRAPNNNLLRTSTGRLFGATQAGGGTTGGGTVYSLDASGVETVIHSFSGGTDGFEPQSNVTRDSSGNLYGTTSLGGTYDSGIVYKIETSGREVILYTFTGGADGGFPVGGVVRDATGNLYGTTYGGGTNGLGTIYEIDTTGQQTVLHSFDATSGSDSWATLLRDSHGNLYGTGAGAVYKLDVNGNYSVVYSFSAEDGGPNQNLLMDAAGNIYGTTYAGGLHQRGTIYKIDPNGNETVLHSFGAKESGWYPVFGLVQDSAGNLYGVTQQGGVYGAGSGDGTVFKFTPKTRTLIILHSFAGPEGSQPDGGLVRDSAGNLYGTAEVDGAYNGGTVFELSFP